MLSLIAGGLAQQQQGQAALQPDAAEQAFLTGIRSGEGRAGDVFTEGCAADSTNFWLIGSSHKTGTEFVEGLFDVAAKKAYGCSAAVGAAELKQLISEGLCVNEGQCDKKTSWSANPKYQNNFNIDKHCVNSEAGQLGMVHVRGLTTDNMTFPQQVRAFHDHEKKRKLRAVLMVRDPVEIIKSAYFYNARGGEPAPRTGTWIAEMKTACRGSRSTWTEDPHSLVCTTINKFDANKDSWMSMLQQLPPKIGIVMEAAHELLGLQALQQSEFAFRKSNEDDWAGDTKTMRVDLNDLMKNFKSVLGQMYHFLGIEGARAEKCVKAAQTLNVADARGLNLVQDCTEIIDGMNASSYKHMRTGTTHEEQPSPAKLAQYKSDSKKALSQITELIAHLKKDTVMKEGNWYNTVNLITKKTPLECQSMVDDPHTSLPFLGKIKEAVQIELVNSNYYKERIWPIRKAMQYA